jgi:hypothetical protein
MPLRYRRKRILFIVLLFILIVYLLNQYQDDSNDQNGLTDSFSISTKHERLVEINGEKSRKIDWHDYESIAREKARTGILIHLFSFISFACDLLGLGEGGTGVEPSAQERNNPDFLRLYRENGFNAFISDNISLDRSVKDIRHPE